MKYTKEQLAGMSDFEVNKSLALTLGWQVADINNISPLGFTESFHKRYSNTIWANKGGGWEQICFTGMDCANDIMPLAFEYAIGVETDPIRKDWLARTCSTSMSNMHFRCYIDKNPLRAIACCLILVLQDKQKRDSI